MLDHLWAAWRSSYIKTVADLPDQAQCLFCRLQEEPDEPSLILERGNSCYSVLNRYPYTTGHLMVTPFRHVGELSQLTTDEQAEMWHLLASGEQALNRAMQPSGFNLGANLGRVAGAGVPGHFHIHLVPRWMGDTNFMSATSGTRVLPEDLEDTWSNLRRVMEG